MRKLTAAILLFIGVFFMGGCVGYVYTEAGYCPPVVVEPVAVHYCPPPPPPPVVIYHRHWSWRW